MLPHTHTHTHTHTHIYIYIYIYMKSVQNVLSLVQILDLTYTSHL